MVVLPDVVLGVDVVLVGVASHVDMRVNVLQLGVVMVRNWSEGVEEVWVDCVDFDEAIPFGFLSGFCSCFLPRCNNPQVEAQSGRIKSKMGGVAHAAKSTQSVRFHL